MSDTQRKQRDKQRNNQASRRCRERKKIKFNQVGKYSKRFFLYRFACVAGDGGVGSFGTIS